MLPYEPRVRGKKSVIEMQPYLKDFESFESAPDLVPPLLKEHERLPDEDSLRLLLLLPQLPLQLNLLSGQDRLQHLKINK